MQRISLLIMLIGTIVLTSCSEDEVLRNTPNDQSLANIDTAQCDHYNLMRSKVFETEDGTYLWGGDSTDQHFNISNFSLDICKLKYGLGREHFKALLKPEFEPLQSRKWPLDSIERAVVIRLSNGNARVYPFSILRVYETVNDFVDGQNVAVVLCFLADLAVVYDRTYCNQTFTFAVSGYTYLDQDIQNGLESFVLWDRDTESLWWPIIDRAVSGPMKGYNMNYSSQLNWEIMRMYQVEDEFPNAEVLMSGQTMDPPSSWSRKERC